MGTTWTRANTARTRKGHMEENKVRAQGKSKCFLILSVVRTYMHSYLMMPHTHTIVYTYPHRYTHTLTHIQTYLHPPTRTQTHTDGHVHTHARLTSNTLPTTQILSNCTSEHRTIWILWHTCARRRAQHGTLNNQRSLV